MIGRLKTHGPRDLTITRENISRVQSARAKENRVPLNPTDIVRHFGHWPDNMDFSDIPGAERKLARVNQLVFKQTRPTQETA